MSLASSIGLTIQLPKFEGPLSLLLYLIKKEEMDIFDIEIHRITNQYFEYIRQMKEMDLEVAGEFVAMAATLIQIKSQLLLPQYNEAGEVIEVEDPRKELVQRLLEYQKFQEAARGLNDRPWLGRDVWGRGYKEKWEELAEEIELEDNALFSLISSYRKAVRSLQKRVHKVAAKAQSVASRIMEIKDRLFINQRVAMGDLITAVEDRRRQVLMTFLSALELAKMGFVRLFQTEHQQEIYIEALKEIDANGISRVEEYEKVQEPAAGEAAVVASETSAVQMEIDLSASLDSGQGELTVSSEVVSEDGAGVESVSAEVEGDVEDVIETSSEFELKDSTFAGEETDEAEINEGEMATDEEILAAEMELAARDEEVAELKIEGEVDGSQEI